MKVKLALLVVLFGLRALGQAQESNAKEIPSSPTLEEVLWWFPPDTETIIAAPRPFRIENEKSITEQLLPSLQYVLIAHLAFLTANDQEERLGHMRNFEVALAVEGARNFRPPRNLGGMPYDGCTVVVLRESPPRTNAVWARLQKNARRTKKISGHVVVVQERMLEEDMWKFFLVRIRPDVLLVCTDEDFLKEVLARKEKRGTTRALPATLPEWKYVDAKAPFWAVRHFTRNHVATDTTSPFGGQKAGNGPDEEAVGVVFSYEESQAQAPKVRYLTASTKGIEIASKFWSSLEEGLRPEVQERLPGVVEIAVPLQGEWSLALFELRLLCILGHGVYI